MGSPAEALPYEDQRYDDIRAQLIESGSLFEDPGFPPTNESSSVKWLRPWVSITRPNALDRIRRISDYSCIYRIVMLKKKKHGYTAGQSD